MATKYLGLDLGMKTLGIAYSDALGFVHGLETLRFDKNLYVVARKHVLKLVEKMGIKNIVLGLPLHMSGKKSDMSDICLRFKDDLLKDNPTLIIEMMDERLSSVTAHKSVSARGMSPQQRKDNVDRIAACIILDTYLRMKG